MSAQLKRSFLLGASAGEAVIAERAETALMLRQHRLTQAARATVASASFQEFFKLRDDLHRRSADGTTERLSVIIRRRILKGLEDEEHQ